MGEGVGAGRGGLASAPPPTPLNEIQPSADAVEPSPGDVRPRTRPRMACGASHKDEIVSQNEESKSETILPSKSLSAPPSVDSFAQRATETRLLLCAWLAEGSSLGVYNGDLALLASAFVQETLRHLAATAAVGGGAPSAGTQAGDDDRSPAETERSVPSDTPSNTPSNIPSNNPSNTPPYAPPSDSPLGQLLPHAAKLSFHLSELGEQLRPTAFSLLFSCIEACAQYSDATMRGTLRAILIEHLALLQHQHAPLAPLLTKLVQWVAAALPRNGGADAPAVARGAEREEEPLFLMGGGAAALGLPPTHASVLETMLRSSASANVLLVVMQQLVASAIKQGGAIVNVLPIVTMALAGDALHKQGHPGKRAMLGTLQELLQLDSFQGLGGTEGGSDRSERRGEQDGEQALIRDLHEAANMLASALR